MPEYVFSLTYILQNILYGTIGVRENPYLQHILRHDYH